MRLAEKWKAGQGDRDNGVLLTVFKNDRKLRIEVGYGLEGVLTDALSNQIIRYDIVPSFKSGNYEQGIINGIAAIQKAIAGEYQARPQPKSKKISPEQLLGLLNLLFWIALVVFIFDLFRFLRFKKRKKKAKFAYNFGEWWVRFAFLFFLLQIIGRIAIYAALSRGGGTHGSRSGYSGGGFSGGGGGSFGGGGSSGSW